MADIRLAKPAAGATQSVPCEPEARFVFDFPTTDATLARDGDNLNIRFEDGSNLQLEGFYQQYNEENLPSFNIDGTEVAAADFFQAMNEPDLMPAAGPGTGTVANGARFHEWGDSALTGGITHLNGLDWGFSRSFEWDDVPNAVGRNGDDWGWWGDRGGAADNPVTIVPEDPTPVPPGTPGLPDGGEPGNQGIVPPGDVRVVDEAGLRGADSVSVNGAMLVTAPDGLASIEIAGQAIWQNGHIIGNPSFATDEGSFHNFAYDASTGRLTYTYTLTSATQEHGAQGPDHIAHSLPVTVRDADGDSASSSITIVIRDDTPEAANDYAKAVEGHEISGTVLVNDDHGADHAGVFAGGRVVRWDVSEDAREGDHYKVALQADGKQYGTVKLYDDGTYVLKAETIGDDDDWKGMSNFTGAPIGYTIVDADGDVAHAVLNLEVLRSKPDITPNKPDPDPDKKGPNEPDANGNRILVDEGDLDGGTGAHGVHGVSGTGTVTIDVNGETGKVNFGGVEFELSGKDDISLADRPSITNDATGVTVTLEKAVFIEETQKWDVYYKYSLGNAQTHANAEKSGEEDILSGSILIKVTDESGDPASGKLFIEVHDDAPVVKAVADAADTVNVSMGADANGNAETVSITFKGEEAPQEWDPYPDGENPGVGTGSDVKGFEGDYINTDGTVIMTADGQGNYSFRLVQDAAGKPVASHNIDIKVVATDSDGDTDNADVTLTVPGITPGGEPEPGTPPNPSEPEVVVGRVLVDEGDQPQQPHEGQHESTGKGSFNVSLNDETKDCSIELTGGEKSIRIEFNDAGEPVIDGKPVAEAGAFLTVQGVKVTVADVAQNADGSWTVSYGYELVGHQDHRGVNDLTLGGKIDITVTDTTGDTAEGVLKVEVHDDAPVVEAVANAADTVNVSMGADTGGGSERIVVSFVGEKGDAEQSWKPNGDEGADEYSNDVKGFEGDYINADGTVIMTADGQGNYSFRLVQDAAGKPVASHNIDIKVVATDSDGDTDNAVVTLTVPGITPNQPDPDKKGDPNEPDAKGNRILVDEGDLEGGTGAHGEHGVSGTGTVTIDVNGETGEVDFGGVKFTLSGKEPINLGNQTIANADTGVTVTLESAVFKEETQKWEVSYKYSLGKAQAHTDAEESGEKDILEGSIPIKVTDASGDTASGELSIEVHDDAPVISEVITVAGKPANAVEFSFGADNDRDENGVNLNGSQQQVEVSLDGTKLTWTHGESSETDLSQITSGEWTTTATTKDAEGNEVKVDLKVSYQDGKYVFAYADKEAENPDLQLDVQITDADGDTARATVSLATPGLEVPPPPTPGGTPFIPATGKADIVVDEGALDEGSQGHAYHGKEGKGHFDVDLPHAEGGTIKLAVPGQDGQPVTFRIDAAAGEGQPTSTPEGAESLEANGVVLSEFKLVYNGEDAEGHDSWTVTYHYELTRAQTHDHEASELGKGDENGFASSDKINYQEGAVTITVTDGTGESVTGQINIEVHDDVPVISAVATEAEGPANAVKFSFGADDDRDENGVNVNGSQQQVTVSVNGAKLEWTESDEQEEGIFDLSQLKSGSWTAKVPLQGQVDEDGHPLTTTVTVEYQDGKYVFAYAHEDAENPDLKLDVQITDADGDTDLASVYLGTQPGEVPDTPGNDSFIPATGNAQIVVDEGALDNGSQGHAYHGKEGIGHFDVDLPHAEGGTIELAVPGTNGQPVTLTFRIDAADGEGQPTWTPVGAESLEANGVVLSEFKLVYNGGKEDAEGHDSWTVTYHYKLTRAQTHDHKASELGEGDKNGFASSDKTNYQEGAVKITVTDGTGESVTGQINIEVHDDAPLAVADFNEVTRGRDGHTEAVEGELLKNDSFGADGKADAAWVKPVKDVEKEDGSYTLNGTYGTLTLHEDGTYSYQLNDEHPEVIELGKDQTLQETFDYQITDGDGDVSTATLTITVAGDHGVTVTPGDNPTGTESVATVYDAGLDVGNHAGETRYPYEVSKTMHIEAKDGVDTIKVGDKTVWENGKCTGEKLVTDDGELTITDYDAGTGTLRYTYTLNSAAMHNKPGEGDRLSHEFTVEVKDKDGDIGEGTIKINVVDDAPVFTSDSYTVKSDDGFETIKVGDESLMIDFRAHGTTWNQDLDVGSSAAVFKAHGLKTELIYKENETTHLPQGLPSGAIPTAQATAHNDSVRMTASFVHYRYVTPDEEGQEGQLQVDNVVDITNAIPYSGKALRLTTEGITVGATTNKSAWNGGDKDGEISAGAGLVEQDTKLEMKGEKGKGNYENAYGDNPHYFEGNKVDTDYVDADNVSEAIVFDLGRTSSYGFKINLGDSLKDGDRVLLTFMQTPANSSDDSIVKLVEIRAPWDPKDGEQVEEVTSLHWEKDGAGNYTISVPDGFTKVIVSALPKATYTVRDDGFSADWKSGVENSGFIIKSVDFLQATEVSHGKVEATSADTVTYDWNWDNLNGAEVLVKGENGGQFTLTAPKGSVSGTEITYTWTAGSTLLFVATIDTESGDWTVTHYHEFELSSGKDPFRIKATDADGDVSTITLNLNPHFTRFAEVIDGTYNPDWGQVDVATKDVSDDILVGTHDNSLMYGKGGDDLLLGDRLEDKARDDPEGWAKEPLSEEEDYGAVQTIAETIKTRSSAAFAEGNENQGKLPDLNHVDADGNETDGNGHVGKQTTSVDQLNVDIMGLSNNQKEALGRELERYEKETNGDDALYGGQGNDLLFGGGGNDYLSGDLESDILYGGGGDDIILYDEKDAYIDGGSGIDILLVGKSAKLADQEGKDRLDNDIRNIEVIIRSENTDNIATLGITSLQTLAQYGVGIDGDNNTIQLSGAWIYDANKEVYKNSSAGLQLATKQTNPDNPFNIVVTGTRGKEKEVLLDSAAAAVIGTSLQNLSYDYDEVIKDHEGLAKQIAADGKDVTGASNIFAGDGNDILFSNAASGFLLGDGDAATKTTLDASLGMNGQKIADYISDHKEKGDTLRDIAGKLEAGEGDLEVPADGSDIIHGGNGSEILYGGGKADHLDGGAGEDILIGGSGDDFLDGGKDSDIIFGGSGNDLIVYDSSDYLIDGGADIDVLLACADVTDTLADMTDSNQVNDVEVLIKGADALNITSMDDLAAKLGVHIEDGRMTLDKGWSLKEGTGGDNGNAMFEKDGVTLETSLDITDSNTNAEAEQAAFTLSNSQG